MKKPGIPAFSLHRTFYILLFTFYFLHLLPHPAMAHVMMMVMMMRAAAHRAVVGTHAPAPAAESAEGAIDPGPAIIPVKRA